MKDLAWLGSALDALKEFPAPVCRAVGHALWLAQNGESGENTKQLSGMGGGVYEVVEDFHTDTFRAVYVAKLASAVYVLHVFQKKSKKGVKTPSQDMEIIRRRLELARRLDRERRGA